MSPEELLFAAQRRADQSHYWPPVPWRQVGEKLADLLTNP